MINKDAHPQLVEANEEKWGKVFINYEQYRLKQTTEEGDILSFRQWLTRTYKPVKLYANSSYVQIKRTAHLKL